MYEDAIFRVAESLRLPAAALEARCRGVVKVDPAQVRALRSEPRRGRVVLVTAMTPTPSGEGKTTTSIGLVDGLRPKVFVAENVSGLVKGVGAKYAGKIVDAFGDKVFHTVIARTVRFPETTVAGEPITTYASSSTGAAAYRQLAREVLAP